MTIRAHLLLLALAAGVPVLAFAVVAATALVGYQKDTLRSGAVEQARALMAAADAELRGSVSSLTALAATRALLEDDLDAFRVSAERVLAAQKDWTDLTLSRPSGEVLIDLMGAQGASEEVRAERQRVVASRAPVIGDVLVDGARTGVPVYVPALRGESVAYVLSATVRPEVFRAVILQARLPPGWISGFVDRKLRFAARLPDLPTGSLASEGFRAALLRSGEGWYRGLTREGVDTFTAHFTSSYSGFSIGLAVPIGVVERGAYRTGAFLALTLLLFAGIALLLTTIITRRIGVPIRSLALAARTLGEGGEPAVHEHERVREVADVARALEAAASAVRERQALLEREKNALQAADAAKDEFLAMLGHELRNPLAALTSAAHLLKTVDPAHPSAVRAREVMERQTAQMTRLIDGLLDVSRIAMGKATLAKRRLNLGELAGRVVETWRTAGRLSDHDVETRLAEVWVDADRERIEQILSNLLDNAIKFTPRGKKIAVSVEREGLDAVLRVADEGAGIPKELLDRVFELFVQGEHGFDRKQGGMGIGLALVQRLTEMHGGRVEAASGGAGRGSVFSVRLRAAADRAVERAQPDVLPARKGLRLVLVEDNDDARAMLAEALTLAGHSVREAANGESGVSLASSDTDVAIVDLGLPDIDGFEVARRLRAGVDGKLRLVALSGYGQPDDQARAVQAGFDLHLTKPVELGTLEQAIVQLIRRS